MGRWEALAETSIDSLDAQAVERFLRAAQAMVNDAERLVTLAAARAASLSIPTVDNTLRKAGCMSSRDARRLARRGEIVAKQPSLGSSPGAVIDTAARACGSLPTSAERDAFLDLAPEVASTCATAETASRRFGALADKVRRQNAEDRLEAQRAAVRAFRGIDPETGMFWLRAELDPETGSRVFAAWDSAVAKVAAAANGNHSPHAYGVALIEMLLGSGAGGQPGAELNIVVDALTLAQWRHTGSVCETYDGQPLPENVVDRLGCVANIAVTVLDEHGELVELGRQRRLPSKAQRNGLRAIYNGCGWPECDARWSACEIHHIKFWEHFGPTDPCNLIPLCRRHHHDIHDRKWQLEMASDRSLTITAPDGSVQSCGPPSRASAAAAASAATSAAASVGASAAARCVAGAARPVRAGPLPEPEPRPPDSPRTRSTTDPSATTATRRRLGEPPGCPDQTGSNTNDHQSPLDNARP